MPRLLFFFLLISTSLSSQYIKNAGFEDWHVVPGTGGQEDPDYWESNNRNLDPIVGYGVSKSTDAHSGNYALKLTPLKDPWRAAQITLGKIPIDSLDYPTFHKCPGDSISYIPLVLTGYYKYWQHNLRMRADIQIYFTDGCYNDMYVADVSGNETFSANPHSYSPFALPIEFASDRQYPELDTLVISISIIDPDSNSANSFLLIDDLAVLGQYVGMDEVKTSSEIAQLFPNPTSGKLTIESFDNTPFSVKVYSIHGKHIFEKRNILGSQYQLELHGRAGVYFVEVISRQRKRVFKVLKE